MIVGMLQSVLALLVGLQSSAALSDQFAAIAKTGGGRVGVFGQVLETSETAGLNEGERFPMQSVYKLPIAMAILDEVERKTLTLNQKVSLSARDMVPGIHSPIRDQHPRGRHRDKRPGPRPHGDRGQRRDGVGHPPPPGRRRPARD